MVGTLIFRKTHSKIVDYLYRGSPLFPFRTEQRKFPLIKYHLLNFPVSSLSSAENNCKWQVPSRWAGLLILEKLLALFPGHPNRFILTNGVQTCLCSLGFYGIFIHYNMTKCVNFTVMLIINVYLTEIPHKYALQTYFL